MKNLSVTDLLDVSINYQNKFTPEEKKQLKISYSKFCNVFDQIALLEINEVQKILHTD